ncbi:MAG: ankyrin repeat domain-containing protein [Vicinamibacterales bacterium]
MPESLLARRATMLVLALATLGAGAAPADRALIDAATRGDLAAVRALLPTVDVNATAADRSTALHAAVERDDAAMVELLLQHRADATAVNRYGVRPISLAAVNGNAGILTQLLKAGADAGTTLPGGETVLMTAARTGSVDAVRTLLAHGAAVNARESRRGQTALMWAAARNNTDVMRVLLENGADLAAHTANESAGVGRVSESGNTFSAPAPTSFTALFFAVRAGHIPAVKLLIAAGADVNETLSDGQSVLIVAAANAHWQLADVLLDAGADPNLAGAGWNALHQTVRTRRPNIGFGTPGPIPTGTLDSIHVIRKMLAKGAQVNARMTRNGMRDGQRNRLNRLGSTAFFLAAKNTDVEVMKLLVAAGADPTIPNAEGTTPLMVASGLMIWNPGEDGGSLAGQEDEVVEAVRMCIDLGNNVNATNAFGETALHGAAYRGVNPVAALLVERGARLDARDVRGWTPLAIANGLSYSDFFKQQVHTAKLLRELMHARGLSTDGHVIDARVCHDCLQTRSDQARAVVERDRRMEAEFAAGTASR